MIPEAPKYQIVFTGGRVLASTPLIFNSWTGRRILNGEEYHAPVLQSDGEPYTGARACECDDCQAFVKPSCRPSSPALRGPR